MKIRTVLIHYVCHDDPYFSVLCLSVCFSQSDTRFNNNNSNEFKRTINGKEAKKTKEITCQSLNRHERVNKSLMTFLMNSRRGHHIKLAGHQELQLAKAAIPGPQINSIFPSLFLSLFF